MFATRNTRGRDLLGAALALSLACGPNPKTEGESEADGEADAGARGSRDRAAVEVVLPLGPQVTLDPGRASDRPSRQIVAALYDTLLDWDLETPEPYDLTPELLEKLPRVSKDGRKVTLELRRGPQAHVFTDDPCFSNGLGRAVRATDVEASLARSDIMQGRIAAYDADDSTGTLTLTLTRPQPELAALLANPQTGIAPRECIAAYADSPSLAVHPVGSGPFALDHASSEPGQHLHLVANPNVAPARAPKLATLDLTRIASPETALRLFQNGELALLAPEQAQFDQVVSEGALIEGSVPEGTRLTRHGLPSVTLLLFRMDDPAIAGHPRLRQAVALAFPADRYHRIIRNGVWAVPARRLVPTGIEGAANEAWHAHAPMVPDLEGARARLDERGDEARPVLRYYTAQGTTAHHEADLFADALEKVGLTMQPHYDAHYPAPLVDPAASPQLFSLRLDADWPSADYFLYEFTCESTLSKYYTHHCDPEYDALFDRLMNAADPERARIIEALERRLGQEVPVRPIDYPQLWQVSQPWLEDVVWHPLAGLRLERLSVTATR